MKKSKNIIKKCLAVLMLLALCIGLLPASARADTTNTQIMTFAWNGSRYIMYVGQYGTASGMSWLCDADGNFAMEISGSGSLKVTDGEIDAATTKVIGGGGGGSSAYGRVGRIGGGAAG